MGFFFATSTYQLCPDVLMSFDLFYLVAGRGIHLQCQDSWNIGIMSPLWLQIFRCFQNTNGKNTFFCRPLTLWPHLVLPPSSHAVLPLFPAFKFWLNLERLTSLESEVLKELRLYSLSLLSCMCLYPGDLTEAGWGTLLSFLFLSNF